MMLVWLIGLPLQMGLSLSSPEDPFMYVLSCFTPSVFLGGVHRQGRRRVGGIWTICCTSVAYCDLNIFEYIIASLTCNVDCTSIKNENAQNNPFD